MHHSVLAVGTCHSNFKGRMTQLLQIANALHEMHRVTKKNSEYLREEKKHI